MPKASPINAPTPAQSAQNKEVATALLEQFFIARDETYKLSNMWHPSLIAEPLFRRQRKAYNQLVKATIALRKYLEDQP